MRRDTFTTGLFIFIVVFLIAGTLLIKWPDFQNKQRVANVANSRSVLELSLTIAYDTPPIFQERYTMRNDNGISSVQYRIQGYSGKVVTITLPPAQTTAVTFFFEEVVQDGIWQLVNEPPRGNTAVHYTLYIHQVADNRQGSRTIVFTDPHYWAVTAGRQYQIHLTPNSPTPDLLKLRSTAIADPRYEKIVEAFRRFGPSSFRRKIAQAQKLVRAHR